MSFARTVSSDMTIPSWVVSGHNHVSNVPCNVSLTSWSPRQALVLCGRATDFIITPWSDASDKSEMLSLPIQVVAFIETMSTVRAYIQQVTGLSEEESLVRMEHCIATVAATLNLTEDQVRQVVEGSAFETFVASLPPRSTCAIYYWRTEMIEAVNDVTRINTPQVVYVNEEDFNSHVLWYQDLFHQTNRNDSYLTLEPTRGVSEYTMFSTKKQNAKGKMVRAKKHPIARLHRVVQQMDMPCDQLVEDMKLYLHEDRASHISTMVLTRLSPWDREYTIVR